MGFYGNITNTSRTQFQFDKTYPNRAAMDNAAKSDGVYIGRYVLIEYDTKFAADWATEAYQKTKEINGQKVIEFFGNDKTDAASRFLYGAGNIVKDKYIRIPATYEDTDGTIRIHNLDNPGALSDIIYLITGKGVNDNPAVTKISEVKDSPYNENYNIDIQRYGPSRGYDSTVWQKVYADEQERYVMVAELNTVVPSFGVSADAPTLSPTAPHFDADSTNVYYKVHWQPTWGLRVKSAAANILAKPIDENGDSILSGNDISLSEVAKEASPSDETTIWSKGGYNTSNGVMSKYYYYRDTVNDETGEITGRWVKSDRPDEKSAAIPAAIYYNKDGFSADKIVYSPKGVEDKITIEPTGLSGQQYNVHDNTGAKEPQVDTQELSIILPSIGNSIAQMWDIVYGNKEINDSNERNTAINWKDASIIPNDEGLELIKETSKGYGYEPNEVETLAGAINSVHNLIGMIIAEKDSLSDSDIQDLNEDYIYYLTDDKKFYRKHKTYTFGNSNISYTGNIASRFTQVSLSNWPSNNTQYFYSDTVRNNNKPNYILEKDYRSGKKYYTVQAPDNSKKVEFTGKFEPYKYFVLNSSVLVNGKTTNVYKTSLDTKYTPGTTYNIITRTMLGENARFYEKGKYYYATFTKESKPTIERYNDFVYFILRNGRYYRATEPFNEETEYYIPTFYKSTTETANSSRQYFSFTIVEEGENIYTERVVYNVATGVTSSNFGQGEYYIESNGSYIKAEKYQSGITYYTREVSYILVEGAPTLKPENAIEYTMVNLVNDKYYCYQPVNSDGYPQYVLVNEALKSELSYNICTINIKELTNFYAPGNYYYKLDNPNSPFYGSYVLDNNDKETKGRAYYSSLGAISAVTLKPYEPYKYYRKINDEYILDTSETKANTTYYQKKGLYVYSDSTGELPVGTEWNLAVNSVPSNISLRERTEKWELQELKGFARCFNTIHGLILTLNKMLENGDTLTREYNSVQGVINQVKDIIAKFGQIENNKVLISDKYGRVTTATLLDDNYVDVSLNTDNKTLSFSHKTSSLAAGDHNPNPANNTTLTFGGNFKLPNFTTDNRGHVTAYNASKVTITLPTPSLAVNGSGNVLTDLNLTASSGALTVSKANVGTLVLTGYSKASSASSVTATDSINVAIGKIEYKLGSSTVSSQIDNKLNTLDATLGVSEDNFVAGIKQENGKITQLVSRSTTTITKLGTIETGTWRGSPIQNTYIGNISADKITSGTLNINRIADGSITSSKINSIDASKITGTLNSTVITNSITSNNVNINSYPTNTITGNITNGDSINVALKKLENKINNISSGGTEIDLPLSIANGGTGATSASAARTALGITPANIGAAASSHNHSAANITSGTLTIARGGTGATTAADARSNLGAAAAEHNHSAANITSGTLPVSRGGTGATSIGPTLLNNIGIVYNRNEPSDPVNGMIWLKPV